MSRTRMQGKGKIPSPDLGVEPANEEREAVERGLRILARVAVRAYLRRRASDPTDATDSE